MANNVTITILRGEYEYLLRCKRRVEKLRAAQNKWADANREIIRAKAAAARKKQKEGKNNEQNSNSNR